MTFQPILSLLLSLALALANSAVYAADANSQHDATIVSKSDIEWQPLNPKRGDKSPQAGMLWGDIKTSGASGFLVSFKEGFSSPPHIHNVSYRGVVIEGKIHNDDADAAKMWMPAGAFWTQPAGESHITAAKENYNIAYIEIDNGPYLVKPVDDAFDSGERPVNIDPSNIVWLNASDVAWASASIEDAKIAFLWGAPEHGKLRGTMLKLSAGFAGDIVSDASEFRAVVIKGGLKYSVHDSEAVNTFEAGSYFGSNQPTKHNISSMPDEETILYIRTNNSYNINSKEK